MKRKKFLTENRLALLIRWWVAGAMYFFVGWGTGLGNQSSVIDFIFFLGLSLGVMNMLIVNPILRRTFNLDSNRYYLDSTVGQKVRMRLSEIFKSMLIVFIMVYIYAMINSLLIQLLSLSEQSIPLPGEPITFGIMYTVLYWLIEQVIKRLKDKTIKEQ
ncbi:hypothetical protein HZI73_21225 [Vallitalea pronyensis]|uniref:Uncharacterized protein n=1 Tax=Vallitalea pronyensis TaxID=1348613 RepID=A0A8J8MNG2_9FIRM|nr:hypothetical protein [Vallitalea pronyensis]QUI24666.1 hypothetical protein HZI73_21225 [Vallitalea pronyensis]